MTKYRKIATIDAEQFDGSKEMKERYHIRTGSDLTRVVWLDSFSDCLPTKEGLMSVNTGDWIATGIDGEHWAIKDSIFRKTYEKVK